MSHTNNNTNRLYFHESTKTAHAAPPLPTYVAIPPARMGPHHAERDRPASLAVPAVAHAQVHSPYGFDAISPSARLYTPLHVHRAHQPPRTLQPPPAATRVPPAYIIPNTQNEDAHSFPPPLMPPTPVGSRWEPAVHVRTSAAPSKGTQPAADTPRPKPSLAAAASIASPVAAPAAVGGSKYAHEEALQGRVPMLRLPPNTSGTGFVQVRQSRAEEGGGSSESDDSGILAGRHANSPIPRVDPSTDRVDPQVCALMKQVAFETSEQQLRWLFSTVAGVTPVDLKLWGNTGGCWLLTFRSAADRDRALSFDGRLLWDVDDAVWFATTAEQFQAVEKALDDHGARRRARDFTDVRLRNVPRQPASIKPPPARGNPSRVSSSATVRRGSSPTSPYPVDPEAHR